MRICVSKDCTWSGLDEQCVRPKHCHADLLCPECYEVTEEIDENLAMLERVGRWYKANGVRYAIAEDVWTLLHRQGINIWDDDVPILQGQYPITISDQIGNILAEIPSRPSNKAMQPTPRAALVIEDSVRNK